MTAKPQTVALIVAAGRGLRAGGHGGVAKQFAGLAGRPVVAWSYAAFEAHPAITQTWVVAPADEEARVAAILGTDRVVAGGATRRLSVRNGLEAIAAAGGADTVLIHDAARPHLPHAVIDRLLGAIAGADGAVPALPVADTLARGGERLGDIVPREALHRIQTPQAFSFATALAAHQGWPDDADATDDAQMVRAAGGDIALVAGDSMLEKLTYPSDFALAEARLSRPMRTRAATGFDVHRLVDGSELWLGGVLIPHAQGLSGHSDADVVLHALTDALLGTIGAGDIGLHFPPSDMRWKGARSDQFLEHARHLISAQGGTIDFVDLTVMCERPRIGPHREAMVARIAALLRLPTGQVSIKATTTERLGFTGRGEGIACQAIATVRVPEDL